MEQNETREDGRARRELEQQPSLESGTRDWLTPRVDELRQRFGITRPDLVAQVLGLPEAQIAAYLEEKNNNQLDNMDETSG
jgi:hypothetical protein